MKFKYIVKKAAVLFLAAALCVGNLTGCGKETKVVFTMGLSGNQVFQIGSKTCVKPELMVYLITFYNQYAKTYGEEMWTHDFGGITLEDYVKKEVLSKMVQIKIMNLMAQERKISLNADEEKKVLEASRAYYQSLPESLKKQEKITQEIAECVYEEYAVANKVYATITESADMEISDDEARTVTVQAIYLKNWKMKNNEKEPMSESETLKVLEQARQLLKRLEEGEDFETLAVQYSDDKQIVKSFARGDVQDNLEKILFSMDEGDLSHVIETKEGYYILKCISTMDDEATQKNKIVLAQQRQRKAFSDAYKMIAENTHSQLRDKYWEKVTIDGAEYQSDADFFKIYEEYVKQ